jgi:hypothetical protein
VLDNTLQALAVIAVLYGSWEAGNKRLRSWVAKNVGSIAILITSITHGVWGTALLSAILIIMQIRGMIVWYRRGTAW